MKFKHIKHIFLIFLLLFGSSALHSVVTVGNTSNSNLVITEVFYDTPGSDSSEEWIELYNPTDSSINIKDWSLGDNSKSNTLPDFTIASGGYFIFARDDAGFNNLYGFYPDSGAMTLALNNGGDQLTLKDDTGTEVDFLAWEEGYSSSYPGWTVSASHTTIHRLADSDGIPIDTNDVSDWEDSGDTGSPDAGYSGTSSSDTEAPVVSISQPKDGESVADTVTISCNSSDNSGSISSMSLFVDSTEKATSSASPISYDWDTTAVADGSHTIRCEATDPSSNVGSHKITVVVDNTPASELFSFYFTDPLAGLPDMDDFDAQEGNISTGLVNLLNSANSTIDAALYHLTWQPAIDALNNAETRGVDVRVAYHGDNGDEFDSLNSGISTTAVTTSYTMHNKFFIVDSYLVYTGSWNPTETGTVHNANDAVKIESTDVASIYQSEFDQLFQNTYANSKTDNNAEMATVGSTQVEIYFSPVDEGRNRLIELIDNSQSSIYISMFYLTDDPIYDAIYNAINRDVSVKLVADYRGWRNSYAEADDLIDLGVGVVDANPGVYHHKFGVFDGDIVWTGSTNWSAAGFDSNDENSVVIHDAGVARRYISRTNQFWDDANNYDSSSTQAPRIVTRHYSSWSYTNMISFRTRMAGNTPTDTDVQYLLWRWNETNSNWETIRELNWASGYYPDFDIEYDTTYYYCLSTLVDDGTHSPCSAEFASQANSDGSNTQPVLYPATGHLSYFDSDTTAPSLTIENSDITATGYHDLYFTVDDESYITEYEIYIDGTLQSTSSHMTWDTTKVSDGIHSIEVKAKDIFGNWGSTTGSITVDNTGYTAPQNDYSDVKVMTYNINMYELQKNDDVDFETGTGNLPFMDVLKEENADIFVLEESGGVEQFGNATLNRIATELNNYFGPSEMPYECTTAEGQVAGFGGITVCSRYPVSESKLVATVNLDDGTVEDPSHDFFDTTIELGTETVHLIGAHLKARSGSSNEAKRERAQEGILNYIDTLGQNSHVIYAGDMNSYAPGEPCETGTEGGCDLGYGPMNMTLNSDHPKNSVNHEFYNAFRSVNPDTLTTPGYTYESSSYGKSVIDYLTINDVNSTGLFQKLVDATTGDTASADTGSDHKTVDASFNLTDWEPVDTTPPAKVTGLTATTASDKQIDLTWDANSESDLDYYNIYRNGTLLTSTTSTTYSDSGLSSSTTYTYEVSAVDTSGNEGTKSDPASAITDDAPDTTPPAKVTGLVATAVNQSQIDLSWDANSESDLDYYNIYRNGTLLTSTTSTTYNDSALSSGTTYTYEVSAVDTSGNEGTKSDPASATTDENTGVGHILISEVLYDAPGTDSDEEWVELYNPTSSDVDLSGWTLSDNSRTFTLPSNTVIGAGEYLVVARDSTGFYNLYGFYPDVDGMTIALSNSGDLVSLADDSGNEIDFVAWENEVQNWDIEASTGETIARSDLTTDTDTVDDWTINSNDGTPGS